MPAGAYEWIDDAAGLRQVVEELRREPVFGIDTEFHREKTYWPQVALVQLSWPGGLALVDPLAVDLTPLGEILAGPGLSLAHAADQDIEVLDRACGAIPSRLFDTQLAAGFMGFSTPSLSALVERLLGIRLAKGDRVSDWTERPLSKTQLDYAASDVAHLHELHRRITGELERRGRLAWAAEECEQLRCRPRLPQDPETAWWRVKECRTLRGASRGVAQAIAAWREREAAGSDRPPRFVLPDLALLGMAHRPPGSIEELRRTRGLDGRHLKGGADSAIMAAIERGRAMGPDELRTPPVDELDRRLRPAVTLTSAWIAQLASDLDIDAALVATRSDLQSFLNGDVHAKLALGWRAGLVGEPVRRLVKGEAALAFDGRGGLALVPLGRDGRPTPLSEA